MNNCVLCEYAKPREDICATYCTGGFTNPDGSCAYFSEYLTKEEKEADQHGGREQDT